MAVIQPDKPWLWKLTHDSATAKTPYSLVKAVTGMSVVAAKRSTPMATMTGLLPAWLGRAGASDLDDEHDQDNRA